MLNANGTYTYTPNTIIKGAIEYTYTVCDNGIPVACDNATLHILVVVSNCVTSNKQINQRLR